MARKARGRRKREHHEIIPGAKKDYHYYTRRIGKKSHRFKLPDDEHSVEFAEAYNRIHALWEASPNAVPNALANVKTRRGTLSWLIEAYQKSGKFKQKGERTKKDDQRFFDMLENGIKDVEIDALGDFMVEEFTVPLVFRIHDKLSETPVKANHVLATLSKLFKYAIQLGLITHNPASGVDKFKGGAGHRPWEDWEIAQFREHWPLGTRERTAFELLINLGQRSGDVRLLTWNHIGETHITLTQGKTGRRLSIPVAEALRAALDAWPRQEHTTVVLPWGDGTAAHASTFGHFMTAAYRAAKLEGVTTHGLRYTAATILFELGCDDELIAAITGHDTSAMVKKYAKQKKRAGTAVARLDEARARKKDA